MNSLKGKRLLVISSDSSDIEFVNAAKEMGVYVVCCDRYTDWSISPAKMLADEAWNFDYTNTQLVAQKCREANIDGVIAGYGEDRVLAACRISKAIGTPFYATEEQINITRDKRLFKKICSQCAVPTPREYCVNLPMSKEELNSINYPVIVKPSDNGGRKGITVCQTEEELLSAVKLAADFSKTGEVVVEDYISGTELCAVYTIVNGEFSLTCLNDKYTSQEDGMSALCDFVITPSKYYQQYLDTIDAGIKKLLNSIGAKNGVANFQFIVNEDGIKAFEMGYRVNGNNDFKVAQKYNNIDFMKMLISYVLTGDMGDDIGKDNPLFAEYFCTFPLLLRAGNIARLDYSKIKDCTNINDISIWKKSGDVIQNTGTNAHKSGMIKFSAKTLDEVKKTTRFLQENIIAENEFKESMLMRLFDVERLSE